jgi:Rieske Fe-S protein
MNEKNEPTAGLKRRDFLLLGAAAAACAGCQGMGGSGPGPHTGAVQTIDAGPALSYAADGVYSNFRALGFFIVRRGEKLEVLSSTCTHRRCKLNVDSDNSFYCHCHGSTFDPDGRVTDGPATRNLPVFRTLTDASGHLLVQAGV